MNLAQEYRRKSAARSGLPALIVVLGILVVCAGGLLIGLMLAAGRKDAPATPRQGIGPPAPQIVVRDPETTARELSDAALAQIGITRPQAEALVTRYGRDTYVVWGTCLLGDERQLYETTCRVTAGKWELVKLTLNGQEIPVGWRTSRVKENR